MKKKLIVFVTAILVSSCAGLKAYDPAANYQKQHQDKVFTSWDDLSDKWEKDKKDNKKYQECKKCY